MKSIVVKFLVMLSAVSSISLANAAEMKIASVDVRKIFNAWKYASEVDEALEQRREKLEIEINERRATINAYRMERSKILQLYKASHESISKEDKAKLDQKYLILGRDASALDENRKTFYKRARRSIDRDITAQSKLILDRISEAIQTYAEGEEYDMVIELGGHTTRNAPLFLHLDGAVDISDIIIKRLNAEK